MRESLREEFRKLLDRAVLDVTIDVLGNVLDAQAAAELFTEECDVAADHGTEVEQQRIFAGLQARKELVQGLGRIRDLWRVGDNRIRCGAGGGIRRCATRPQHAEQVCERTRGLGHGSSERRLGADLLPLLGLILLALLRLLLLLLVRLGAGTLHVDAATEMRAFSNGDAR